MKHIKNFETNEKALLQQVENPSVIKIADNVYYSEQDGIITSVGDNSIEVQQRKDYYKSIPLTITNVGNSDGEVSIYFQNPDPNRRYTPYYYLYLGGQYSNPGGYNYNSTILISITVPAGESITVYTTANDNVLCNYTHYQPHNSRPHCRFLLEGSKFKASGNLLSLNTTNYVNNNNSYYGVFHDLFRGCVNLIDIKDLYCPIVGDYCYRETFLGTNVDTLPIFDGFDIYQYSLQWAFKYCPNLIDLSDYTLIDQEYVLSGEGDCYGMFEGCANLEKSPVINGNYAAPYQYTQMFSRCQSLKEITHKGAIDTSQYEQCYGWVEGVNDSGIMYINTIWYSNLVDQGCGTSTYPCGWEVKTI